MKKLLLFVLMLAFVCPAFAEQAQDLSGMWYLESLNYVLNTQPYVTGSGVIQPGFFTVTLNGDGTGFFSGPDAQAVCVWTDETLTIGEAVYDLKAEGGRLTASREYEGENYEMVFSRKIVYSVLPEVISAADAEQYDGVYDHVYTVTDNGLIYAEAPSASVTFTGGKYNAGAGWLELTFEEGALHYIMTYSAEGGTYANEYVFQLTQQPGVVICDVCDSSGGVYVRHVFKSSESDYKVFNAFEGENADARLANAFENDALKLIQKDVELSVQDFALEETSDEALAYYGLDRATLAAALSAIEAEDCKLISLSPSGNSGLIASGSTLFAMYEGRYRLLYPWGGIEDIYGSFDRSFSQLIGRGARLNNAGVSYSPDGRYAVICDAQTTIRNAKGYDLMLINLESGEVSLLASRSGRIMDDDFGLITASAFSGDGKGLYYLVYGRGKSSLRYIDLATLEDALVVSAPDGTLNTVLCTGWYYPLVAETRFGDMLLLSDVSNREMPQGIARLKTDDGVKFEITACNLPVSIGYFYTGMLSYSKTSNKGLIVSRRGHIDYQESLTLYGTTVSFPDLFVRFTADGDMSGIDEVWALKYGADRAEKLDLTKMESDWDYLSRFAHNYKAVLSPDGEYALMLARFQSEYRLYMLRLEDMALREVTGIDANNIVPESALSSYLPTIEWNGDTLIISTFDGPITCAFEW